VHRSPIRISFNRLKGGFPCEKERKKRQPSVGPVLQDMFTSIGNSGRGKAERVEGKRVHLGSFLKGEGGNGEVKWEGGTS